MRFLKRFFKRRHGLQGPDDLMEITRIIGPLIDQVSSELFMGYRSRLLEKPLTFIVPAIWGTSRERTLTGLQEEIHRQIGPVIQKIIQSFRFTYLTRAQEFALGYLIRGLLVSKITFMIEVTRNGFQKPEGPSGVDFNLEEIEPIGSA